MLVTGRVAIGVVCLLGSWGPTSFYRKLAWAPSVSHGGRAALRALYGTALKIVEGPRYACAHRGPSSGVFVDDKSAGWSGSTAADAAASQLRDSAGLPPRLQRFTGLHPLSDPVVIYQQYIVAQYSRSLTGCQAPKTRLRPLCYAINRISLKASSARATIASICATISGASGSGVWLSRIATVSSARRSPKSLPPFAAQVSGSSRLESRGRHNSLR